VDPAAADLQLPEEQVLDNATSPGARRLKYVIGIDDRRPISPTTTFPWYGVGFSCFRLRAWHMLF
jgi:V8-like Glu-specific endopeptidase